MICHLIAALAICLGWVLPAAAGDQFGWRPDAAAAAELAATTQQLYGDQVAALETGSDDRDALLYRYAQQLLDLPRIAACDQGSAGTCVGASTTQALGIGLAVEILFRGDRDQWRAPYSIEATYAMGRQVAGQLGRWDGSSGAWQCRALAELGTAIAMDYRGPSDQSAALDLRAYSPQRAQEWAARGVPGPILTAAEPFPVRAVTRVTTIGQARAMLQNGYCLITCSRESYIDSRDPAGFARNDNRNAWPHAMAIVGYRGAGSGRRGFLILNSWGPGWCKGPVWPEDQPLGSFWISESDLGQHLAAGDTWAIGDIQGFRGRRLKVIEAIDTGGPVGLDLAVQIRPFLENYKNDSVFFVFGPAGGWRLRAY